MLAVMFFLQSRNNVFLNIQMSFSVIRIQLLNICFKYSSTFLDLYISVSLLVSFFKAADFIT